MKIPKLYKIAVSACFLLGFVSCQNDFSNSWEDNTPIEQQVKKQKMQILYEKYKDMPIQSLFNSSRATREVLNGQCVIGVIQYCGNKFGKNISTDEIVKYFGDKVQKDDKGNIIGISLSSSEWDSALNHWFTATFPSGQWDLIEKISNGDIACCRLGSDRTHAVVLVGVDENSEEFTYYDPVLGGENHKAAFTQIYDPRIITQ